MAPVNEQLLQLPSANLDVVIGNGDGKRNGQWRMKARPGPLFEATDATMALKKQPPISDCDSNDHHLQRNGRSPPPLTSSSSETKKNKSDTVASIVLPPSSANGGLRGHHNHHHQPHRSVQKQTSNNSTATTNITWSKRSPHKKKKKSRTVTYERPPDGGWGWMVVVASFIINLIADGVSLSFGVIYVELVDYFNESKSKTAWVGSLFLSIPLITGPIASALVDHFGCRKVTIVGSLLAASGFFIGQFSTCIEHLFFAFSLSGFGLALCYVTSIVSVAYWFDKRRSLATGLAVCGTGFGTFLFAPFIIYLLNEYQWRGTLLILSAVFLNMICCGFLIRDLNIDATFRHPSPLSSSSSSSSSPSSEDISDLESNLSVSAGGDLESDSETDDGHPTPSPDHKAHRLLWTRPRPISECDASEEPVPRHTASLINIPTYIHDGDDQAQTGNDGHPISADIFGELTFRRGGYLHKLICYYPHLLSMFLPSLRSDIRCDDLTVKTKIKTSGGPVPSVSPVPPPKTGKVVEFGSTHHIVSNNNPVLVQSPQQQQQTTHNETKLPGGSRNNSTASRLGSMMHNLTWRHSSQPPPAGPQRPPVTADYLNRGNRLHNLRLPRGSLTYRSAMLVINKYRLKASSAPDIYRTSMVTINEEKSFTVWHNLKEILLDMVDVSNLKSIRYTIFCVSNFLLYACIDVPYVYIPDLVITTGASDQEGASAFISIIGIFNTIGVVLVGYIGDKPFLDTCFVYAILVSISGLAMGAIPLSNNYYVLALLSAIYGFCISANYSLVSVILVKLISLDLFTKAYGMLLLVQGFGSLIGPPLAGWLYDVSGNYDNAFYITGFTILISGLMVIPVGDKKNCFLCHQPEAAAASTSDPEETTEMIITTDDGGTNPTDYNHNYHNHHHPQHRPLTQRLVTIEEDSEI